MIICLGPVCVPIWPLLFLAAKPIWTVLPEAWRENLKNFWYTKVYPKVEPYLEKLPAGVRKVLFYGMPIGGGGKKKENKTSSSKSDDGGDSTTCSDENGSLSQSDTAIPKKFESDFNSGTVHQIESESDFHSITSQNKHSSTPIFVNFTAAWCKPCEAIKPVFNELAKSNAKDAFFVTVDIDDELDDVALELDVVAIPAIHMWRYGKLEEKMSAPNEEKLRTLVEKVVEKGK